MFLTLSNMCFLSKKNLSGRKILPIRDSQGWLFGLHVGFFRFGWLIYRGFVSRRGRVIVSLLHSFHSAMGGDAQSCYKFRHGRGCSKLFLILPWAVVNKVVVNSTMGEDAKSSLIPPWSRVHKVVTNSAMGVDAQSRYWFRHGRISRITAGWRRLFHIFVNWFFFHNISTFGHIFFWLYPYKSFQRPF